jgi:tyrosyl-tRNA synthetase
MDLLADLEARGLVHDTTDRAALAQRLGEGPIAVYVGFDPTADSLHAGHLLGQVTLRRFQLAGHRPFPLAGGATGMVGDPGGRSEERNLLDRDTLRHNVARIKDQLERILDFDAGASSAMLVDNADWTVPMGALEFLRDVGKHVTVNQMLAKESVRARLESDAGISYTEFSYMLLQANDFRHLREHHGVEMQMGGSDQWGNIVTGIDLIRRRLGVPAYGLTWPLITRSDGEKMGKSVGGALWLDPAKTSPYQFHQYWLQVADADVERFLLQLTFRSVEDVRALVAEHDGAPERRRAQRALADDVTTIVHGAAAARAAAEAGELLFGGDPFRASADALTTVAGEVPSSQLTAGELDDPVELLVATALATSKSDARRLLQQGSVRANGTVIAPGQGLDAASLLHGRFLLLRKGKRSYHLAEILGAEVDAPRGGR